MREPDQLTPEWYGRRLVDTLRAGQEGKYAVWATTPANWQRIQEAHQKVLDEAISPECTFLDAGCGVGTLYDVLPHERITRYIGVDWCSAFIAYALMQRPQVDFRVADLMDLSMFADKEFSLCVMRGYGSVVSGTWDAIVGELKRVAEKVLCLASTVPDHTRWL